MNANAGAKIHGLQGIELESDWLRVTILPEVGAKIWDLIWKPQGRNMLWHNPRILPQRYPIDSNFDNYWCGGWDDGFPSCEACEHRGEQIPNLGELRSLHWTVDSVAMERGDAVARLSAFGPISPVQARKIVTVAARSPVVSMRYEITNLGPMTLDYIWGTHPALAITENTILRIPAKTGIVGQASDPRLGTPGQRYSWPNLETPAGATDISRTQSAQANVSCGHYVTDLEAGWYAVENPETGVGFLLRFPADICPYLWLWLTYGAWRGYHTAILEPWTSYPVTLSEAVRQGTHRRLEAGKTFSAEVRATVYAPPETWQEALKRME